MSSPELKYRAFSDAGVFTNKAVLASLIVLGDQDEIHRQVHEITKGPIPGSFEAEILAVKFTLEILIGRNITEADVYIDCLPIITVIEHPSAAIKLKTPKNVARGLLRDVRDILCMYPKLK